MSDADAREQVITLQARVATLEREIALLRQLVQDNARVTLRWSEVLAEYTRRRVKESRKRAEGAN